MSIFVCAKCGCIDNTAVSDYWALMNLSKDYKYDRSLEKYRGKPLCSKCAKVIFDETGNNPQVIPGEWHGKFPRRKASSVQLRCLGHNNIIND